jgi:WD40 repeat protein
LWALPGGTRIRTLTKNPDRPEPNRLAFTPDGKTLLVPGGNLGWVERWSVPDGRTLTPVWAGLTGLPQDLAVSGDGTAAAAVSQGAAPTLMRFTSEVVHPDAVSDLAFDPTGNRLAIAGADGMGQVRNPATGPLLGTVAHAEGVRSVAYAPDGTLASAATDGTVRILEAGHERPTLTVGGEGTPHDLAFSPDGSLLAMSWSPPAAFASISSLKSTIYVWQARTLQLRAALDMGTAGLPALAFTPDGSRLFAAITPLETTTPSSRHHGELRSWRTGDLGAEPTADLGDQQVIDIAVSPDGRTLAVAGFSRTIELRNLNGTLLRRFGEHPANIRRIAFSPDGRTLATVTSSDSVVRLWDVASGTLLANLTGHLGPPNAVVFSPRGDLLASGGTDGSVDLWHTNPDATDRYLCRVLESSPNCG